MMLVNCGACEDLRQLLSLNANTRAVVIDSHRPIHHRCARGFMCLIANI